jgi:alpha-tubulin suppressor-like RCC1 family protein
MIGGELYCWGSNADGELGTGGPLTGSATPARVTGITGVSQFVAGGAGVNGSSHTCAIVAGGALWCWGENVYGQLGVGSPSMFPVPTATMSMVMTPVSTIGLGGHFACSVSGGDAYCWGSNTRWQLGDMGSTRSKPTMAPIALLGANVQALAGGREHACALTSTNEVWCWGINDAGQMGNGVTSTSAVPARVGTNTYTKLVVGNNRSCAVAAGTGKVLCWGRADAGLGDGTKNDSFVPKATLLTGTAQSIAIGSFHMCAVMSSTLWCWGLDFYGEVGNGAGATSIPSQIATAFTPVEVVAGHYFTCARDTVGDVWCWGANDYGQLGLGTASSSFLPIDIALPR